MDIPVVDARSLEPGKSAFEPFVEALRSWGFFHLTHHGIDVELTERFRRQMRAFFDLPHASKQGISRTANNPWGYYDAERTKNRVDAKEILDIGPAEGEKQPQWPSELPQFEPTAQAWSDACCALSLRLLKALSQAMQTPEHLLTQHFTPSHSSFLRLNHYPVINDPAPADTPWLPEQGRFGIHHHTDAGALTVLLQDEVPGLQVAHDEEWHLVQPRPDALVINIGDIVQVWSNDRFPAVLHRVVGSTTVPRYSAAFFYNPAYTARYAPLTAMCSATNPARYQPINWGAFRAGRSDGDFADYGAEIQISDFRIA